MRTLTSLLFLVALPVWAANESVTIDTKTKKVVNPVVKFGSGNTLDCTGATVTNCGSGGGGSGTVTSFSAGLLSPLFTTSVANSTTTPALSFTLSTAAAHKFFGNNTGSTAAPGFQSIGTGDLPDLSSTYVPTSRTISTTSPITGAGDLSANRTIGLDVSVDHAFTAAQSITLNDSFPGNLINVLSLSHNTTGTPTVGLGTGVIFRGETDTTTDRVLATIGALWTNIADASRSSRISLTAVSSGSLNGQFNIFGSGGASLNSSTDPGSGILLVSTGIRTGVSVPGANTILKSDGAKFVKSTETYAAPGTIGNLMLSDGTNWTSATRQNPRVTAITSNATWSPNADTDDIYEITAQSAAVTTISNPSGTPVDGQKLIIRVKDNGTARALTWSGSQWRAGDIALPTTTVLSKTLYLGFIYNSADTKWDLIALVNNF